MARPTSIPVLVCALLTAAVASVAAQDPLAVELAPDHAVVWGPEGATITYQGRTSRFNFRAAYRNGIALPVRYTRMVTGSPRETRHFFEVAAWNVAGTRWKLDWRLFEVDGDNVRLAASESEFVSRSDSPPVEEPLDLRTVIALRVNDAGAAEYARLVPAPQQGRVVESPAEQRLRRDEELLHAESVKRADWSRTFDLSRAPSFQYLPAEGCVDLSLTALTHDRAEAIRILVDKQGLRLEPGRRVIDLARERRVSVTLRVYSRALRESPFCSSRLAPAAETLWRTVSGTITIELSPKGVAPNRELYRATIRLENAHFVNSEDKTVRQPFPITLSALAGVRYGRRH